MVARENPRSFLGSEGLILGVVSAYSAKMKAAGSLYIGLVSK